MGIGRTLMHWLMKNYSEHLQLDVSTDNDKAINFYSRIGLVVDKKYLSGKPEVEFATFVSTVSK